MLVLLKKGGERKKKKKHVSYCLILCDILHVPNLQIGSELSALTISAQGLDMHLEPQIRHHQALPQSPRVAPPPWHRSSLRCHPPLLLPRIWCPVGTSRCGTSWRRRNCAPWCSAECTLPHRRGLSSTVSLSHPSPSSHPSPPSTKNGTLPPLLQNFPVE